MPNPSLAAPRAGRRLGIAKSAALLEPTVPLLVGHGPDEADLARHAVTVGEPFQLAAKRAVADDDPFGFRNPGQNQRHRPHHDVMSLVAFFEACDRDEPGSSIRRPRRCGVGGKIDAGRDERQSRPTGTSGKGELPRIATDRNAGGGVVDRVPGQARPRTDLFAVEVLHGGDRAATTDRRRCGARNDVRAQDDLGPMGDRFPDRGGAQRGDRDAAASSPPWHTQHSKWLLAVKSGGAGCVQCHHADLDAAYVPGQAMDERLDTAKGRGEVRRDDKGLQHSGRPLRWASSQRPKVSTGHRMRV